MIQKKIVAFGLVALSLVACVAQEGTEEHATESVSQAIIKDTPEAGQSCHVEGAGITNGTMTDHGWCCGVSTCLDKDACGANYGHLVSSCAACDWFKCDPGAARVGGRTIPELLASVDGKLELLSTDPKDPGYAVPYKPAGEVKRVK